MTKPNRVVVGFNDTKASTAALDWAAGAAPRLDADLSVVWVLPTATAWEYAAVQLNPDKRREEMVRRLDQVCVERLGDSGIAYRSRVIEGSPTGVLRGDGSRPGAALLVVGASRRGSIGDLVMGSVAHDLVHDAPVPVVVVPSSWTPASSGDANTHDEVQAASLTR
jgi:nucleotide-binding universal stress UspA family protein